MSCPPDASNSDNDFTFTFNDLDDVWPLVQDTGIFLTTEDCDKESSLNANIFQQEHCSEAATSINIEKLLENRLEHQHHKQNNFPVPPVASDNLRSLIQEKSTLHIDKDDKAHFELTPFVFEVHENPVVVEPIIDKGLPESSNKYHEDNNLFTALTTWEKVCPSLEESSTDTNSCLDPITILDQGNLELDLGILKELQVGRAINNYNDKDTLSNFIETSDKPWSLLEEGNASLSESNDPGVGLQSNMFPEQQISLGNRLNAKKKERNHRFKLSQTEEQIQLPSSKEVSTSKKQEHNAKEKVRRVKLNESYLALGALVPDSQRKKKRRSVPVVIDRAIEYIPELQKEIEKLTLKKNTLLSTIENKRNVSQSSELEHQPPTVSVNEVQKGEVIVQIICNPTVEDSVFSTLLQKVEAEDMVIISASTNQVCEKRISYHLHIQMNGSSVGANSIAVLSEKFTSWLH